MKGGSNASPRYNNTNNDTNGKSNSKRQSQQPLIWGMATIGKASSPPQSALSRPILPRLMFFLLLFVSLLYFFYTLNILLFSSSSSSFGRLTTSCATTPVHLSTAKETNLSVVPSPPLNYSTMSTTSSIGSHNARTTTNLAAATTGTGLQHIVFGIAASARLWDKRKEYIKIWWRPRQMRGFVWLDKPVDEFNTNNTKKNSSLSLSSTELPVLKISSDTSKFPYTHKQGSRSAIRLSRIVSETLRLGLPNVRWFVMGDDDTVFVPDNLVRVLARYDHRQPYYIGSLSESHLQNIYFSYGMAYGGGGFAISRPLAESISRIQDKCLHRYPALYGSDDRIQACMAELGIPLTRHPGFHQYDVYGNLLGLLAAHPVAPLVTLHHLDVVEPIFPGVPSRGAAIRRLFEGPVALDSAGVMQQSICYNKEKLWTVSVSWGFVVMVVRGVISPREMEMPARTFLNWYRRADYTAYAFNTRPMARNPCQKPFVYYLSSSRYDPALQTTVTTYTRHRESPPLCRWRMADPSSLVDDIIVYKRPDPSLWDRAPRRNCCRVMPLKRGKSGNKTMTIDLGVCKDGEVSEI